MKTSAPASTAEHPANHRRRVGAARRARMRARLVECALLVFAEHGIDVAIIDKGRIAYFDTAAALRADEEVKRRFLAV